MAALLLAGLEKIVVALGGSDNRCRVLRLGEPVLRILGENHRRRRARHTWLRTSLSSLGQHLPLGGLEAQPRKLSIYTYTTLSTRADFLNKDLMISCASL